jgi:hypothetical protein
VWLGESRFVEKSLELQSFQDILIPSRYRNSNALKCSPANRHAPKNLPDGVPVY